MIKRVALVTGASRGIGAAIARKLAEHGYRVALVARHPSSLEHLAASLPEALALGADVSRPSDVEGMIRKVMDTWGRLDVLVNNAGVAHIGKVEDLTLEAWDHVMAVNARGPFLCTRAVLPLMRAQHGGHIVNILSIAAKRVFPEWSAYCASKFALDGFGRALAEELKGTGILVTQLYPGATDSALWDAIGMAHVERSGMVRPEDVAEAVLFALTQPAQTRVAEIVIEPAGGDL